MDSPLVSVRVITYQNGPHIKECIESILMQQTDFPFEICIGEDGSVDGTREVCIDYANKFPETIRTFLWDRNDKRREGLPPSRFNFINTIAKCNGKYIALLDGDDFWTDPYKLQKQADFLSQNPNFGGSYHNTMVIYENADRKEHLFRENLSATMNTVDTLAIKAPFHTSSFCFRKEYFVCPDFFTKVVSADMALFSIISASGALGKVEGVMSRYRINNKGITSVKQFKDNYHMDRMILIQHLNAFHHYKFNEKARRVIAFHERKIMERSSIYHRMKKLIREVIKRVRNPING